MNSTFDNAEEARQWADEWLRTLGPSPVITELLRYETDHREQVLRDYGRLVAQFEAQYTALAQLIEQVNFIDRSSWPPHRAVQYVLMSNNLKPFWSAVDRLTKGFYEDALTLLRGLRDVRSSRLCHVSLGRSLGRSREQATQRYGPLQHDQLRSRRAQA